MLCYVGKINTLLLLFLNIYLAETSIFFGRNVHAFGRNVHVISGWNGSWPKRPVTPVTASLNVWGLLQVGGGGRLGRVHDRLHIYPPCGIFYFPWHSRDCLRLSLLRILMSTSRAVSWPFILNMSWNRYPLSLWRVWYQLVWDNGRLFPFTNSPTVPVISRDAN